MLRRQACKSKTFSKQVSKARRECSDAQAAHPPWRECLNSVSYHGQIPRAGEPGPPWPFPSSGTGGIGLHPKQKAAALKHKVYVQSLHGEDVLVPRLVCVAVFWV